MGFPLHQRPSTYIEFQRWARFVSDNTLQFKCSAKEVMRRHGAKAINVPLGALRAPSAKSVPGLLHAPWTSKLTLLSF